MGYGMYGHRDERDDLTAHVEAVIAHTSLGLFSRDEALRQWGIKPDKVTIYTLPLDPFGSARWSYDPPAEHLAKAELVLEVDMPKGKATVVKNHRGPVRGDAGGTRTDLEAANREFRRRIYAQRRELERLNRQVANHAFDAEKRRRDERKAEHDDDLKARRLLMKIAEVAAHVSKGKIAVRIEGPSFRTVGYRGCQGGMTPIFAFEQARVTIDRSEGFDSLGVEDLTVDAAIATLLDMLKQVAR